jgi:hypothetical protein
MKHAALESSSIAAQRKFTTNLSGMDLYICELICRVKIARIRAYEPIFATSFASQVSLS